MTSLAPARAMPRTAAFCRAVLTCAACAMLLQPQGLGAQTTSASAQAQAQAQQSLPLAEPAMPGGGQQPAPHPARRSRNPKGSPLDTLLSTRLWADVPEAKDFVRESRRPPESLDFRPTSGTDPERPKPRTKVELDLLRAELESAGQKNEKRAAGLKTTRPPQVVKAAQNGKAGEAKKELPN